MIFLAKELAVCVLHAIYGQSVYQATKVSLLIQMSYSKSCIHPIFCGTEKHFLKSILNESKLFLLGIENYILSWYLIPTKVSLFSFGRYLYKMKFDIPFNINSGQMGRTFQPKDRKRGTNQPHPNTNRRRNSKSIQSELFKYGGPILPFTMPKEWCMSNPLESSSS